MLIFSWLFVNMHYICKTLFFNKNEKERSRSFSLLSTAFLSNFPYSTTFHLFSHFIYYLYVEHRVFFFLLGKSRCIITKLGSFLKITEMDKSFGEHVFVCRNRVAPKCFLGQARQRAKSCGGERF